MSRTGSWLLEAPLLLALAVVWPAIVLWLHAQPGGVTIEVLVAGVPLLALHLHRWAGIVGLTRSAGSVTALIEAAALAALALQHETLAMGLGSLGALPLVLSRDPVDARPSRALHLTALLVLALATAALALAVASGRALAWQRLILLLPVLWEALAPRRTRGADPALRRAASGALVLTFAVCRFEALLGLLAGSLTALGALLAWRAARATDPRAAWRRDTLRATAVAVPLLTILLLGEVAIRLIPNHYRDLTPPESESSRPTPGGVTTYTGGGLRPAAPAPISVRWNSLAMHDTEHEPTRRPGTVRVLVLGDSFVEGKQVDLEQLFHRRLEAALRSSGAQVETLSLARSGWGQADAVQALEAQGLEYDPDLVLFEFLPLNDVRDNLPALEALSEAEQQGSTFARPLFADAVRKRLMALAWAMDGLDKLLRRAEGARQGLDLEVFRDPPARAPELWAVAWERTAQLLEQAARSLAARGARAAVVVFPSSLTEVQAVTGPPVIESLDLRLPARRISSLCAAREIPCLDLAPAFAARGGDPQAWFLPWDGHWSPAGHALAAEETARWLRGESGLWEAARARAAALSRGG